jgi:hypothetical protein
MLKKLGRLDEIESVMAKKVESADKVVQQIVQQLPKAEDQSVKAIGLSTEEKFDIELEKEKEA